MTIKRLFDLFFTVPGIILLLPLFIFIAVWIKLDSPGKVFYEQERVGQNGRCFKIIKFRTMVADADKKGLALTVGEDPRITKAGSFLRKSKIDELPQLINVLLGDMSLVGPRPEVPNYVQKYTEEQRRVLKLKPGITDPASIKYKDENALLAASYDNAGEKLDPEFVYITEIMPDKININLEYAVRANILTDFILILSTIMKVTIR